MAVKVSGNKQKGLIVLVKPSDKASYSGLVDILDEFKITEIASYNIVETD